MITAGKTAGRRSSAATLISAAKPIGPGCNLNCAYCGYLPRE